MDTTNNLHTSGGLLPFDPIVLLQDLIKRWLVILLAAVVVGVGAYIKTDMDYTPVYQTNTIFVVTTRGSSTTVYSNLTSTSSVANLFTGLLNSSIMRNTVAQEMGVDSVNGTISTAVIPNTNLISMKVQANDPRTAFLISQTLIDHHETLTYQIVDGIVMEVLQHPVVPTAPINSANAAGQMKRMMLLAAAAAIAVLATLSFLRDAVRSETEVRNKLDCNYLGEIPHEKKYKTIFSGIARRKTSILITNPVTGFRFVETVRKLRRRVEQHMGTNKVLMVTSLLENEGKSTVAANLALAMAQKHKKVLLIDCDLRKPACHAILGYKDFSSGIKEVLQGKATLNESMLRYKTTNMYMLLAKKADRNTGELLSSERMGLILDWARENFDCVILDTPPMSAGSDTESMTYLADASIMVVRQNTALATPLNKAIAALEGNRAQLLGCVLNNVYSTSLTSGTGYGYGYGYGYGRYRHYGQYGSYGSGHKK